MSVERCSRCGGVRDGEGKMCVSCQKYLRVWKRRRMAGSGGGVSRELARLESTRGVVRNWNAVFPGGTPVRVQRNDGSVGLAVTVGEAELIAGVPVVKVEGEVFGTFQLSRLEVV